MRTFWRWLGTVQIVIRWPRRAEHEDWCSESRGAVRW